jgi:hypothetical protein
VKTPLHLQKHGIAEITPSRKLWRAPLGYCGPFKKEFISSWWALEHTGALAQIGDPGARVDRVPQKQIAAILGITRETLTKRLMIFSSPDPEWDQKVLCKCHGRPRRECQSQKLRAIAANHPHWNKGSESADFRGAGSEEGDARSPSEIPHQGNKEAAQGAGLPASKSVKDGSRVRKHVGVILARNAGFAVANSYAIACKDGDRPSINAGANQVGFLAHTFGAHLFSREKQTWANGPLKIGLEGFRRSIGWIWDQHLPDAPDCACMTGQLKLSFQEVCPRCGGAGFVVGGSLPDYGRMLLHWLVDRGIDEEWRSCAKCTRTFTGKEMCPGCGARGQVIKKRGELNNYTQEDIAQATGLDVSTVRRYFTTFKRLQLVRTVPGEVWRKCLKCKLPPYTGQCPGCKSNCTTEIVRRDPQLIIWLTSRTLDKQIADTERRRLAAIVAAHRRWLDHKHLAELQTAADLAKRVLGEWEGHEHLLISFYNEMRRRLEASKLRANFINVLFPRQRE